MFLLALFFAGASGCHSTRYVPKGKYLLKSIPQVNHNSLVPSSAISRSIRMRPNRRMLVPKTYLYAYNFGRTMSEDSSWIKKQLIQIKPIRNAYSKSVNWLMKGFGEAPVLVDTAQISEALSNLRNLYFSYGYFYPEIGYEIDTLQALFRKQKAKVTFNIAERQAFVIDSVDFQIDAPVNPRVFQDFISAYNPKKSLVQKGNNYQHDSFEKERAQGNRSFEECRVFSLFAQNDKLLIDTTNTQSQAIRPIAKSLHVTIVFSDIPKVYRIRNIRVNLNAAPDIEDQEDEQFMYLRGTEMTSLLRDSLGLSERRLSQGSRISFFVKPAILKKLNYNFIAQRIFFKEDSLYSLKDARATQRKIQELVMFQFLTINYAVIDTSQKIDVIIDMQLVPKYQAKIGAETFSNDIAGSNNLPVVGGNLALRNRNTFRKSDLLEFNFQGNVGFYASGSQESQFEDLFFELGGQLNLNFPRFILGGPFKLNQRLLNPSTILSSSFNNEFRSEFNRTIAGLDWTYRWNHKQSNERLQVSSQLSPLAIDFVFFELKDSTFQRDIEQLPSTIQRDYQTSFNSRLSYRFTYSTFGLTRLRPTWYYRLSLETGGNLPRLIEGISKRDNDQEDNLLFEKYTFGQYFKTSFETKVYIPLTNRSELIVRNFLGVASSYGKTNIVPQESRFFSGGTNSMRGWQSNTLGPGTLSLDDITDGNISNISQLVAPGGEYMFEANAELRFDVYSYLEMALFTDIGNVWFSNRSVDRGIGKPASAFTSENLKLGWDAGIGFRFDFSFLILRFDLAQQLSAPDVGWVLNNSLATGRRLQLNLGIGYPF